MSNAGTERSRISKLWRRVGAGTILIVLVWNRLFPVVAPGELDSLFNGLVHLGRLGPEHLLAAVVGFYFGSRSWRTEKTRIYRSGTKGSCVRPRGENNRQSGAHEMMTRNHSLVGLLIFVFWPVFDMPSLGQQVKLVDRPPDPHGSPPPARARSDVPVKTSFYFELETPKGATTRNVAPESVSANLQEEGGDRVDLLHTGQRFNRGASGWLRPKQDLQGANSLAIYIEPPRPLKPGTKYTVAVSAGEIEKGRPSAAAGTWSFTTESVPAAGALEFSLDLKSEPVRWRGRFFSGICNVIFCTQAANYGSTFDLMSAARKRPPQCLDLAARFLADGH